MWTLTIQAVGAINSEEDASIRLTVAIKNDAAVLVATIDVDIPIQQATVAAIRATLKQRLQEVKALHTLQALLQAAVGNTYDETGAQV